MSGANSPAWQSGQSQGWPGLPPQQVVLGDSVASPSLGAGRQQGQGGRASGSAGADSSLQAHAAGRGTIANGTPTASANTSIRQATGMQKVFTWEKGGTTEGRTRR